MPIYPKVVSKERRDAAARGQLTSAGGSRPAAANTSAPAAPPAVAGKKSSAPPPSSPLRETDDSDSPTSSDSDASSVASSNGAIKPTAVAAQRKAHRDPLEDHAEYCRRNAKQEWLFATGQAGPTPPPPKLSKPSSTAAAAAVPPQSPPPASKSAELEKNVAASSPLVKRVGDATAAKVQPKPAGGSLNTTSSSSSSSSISPAQTQPPPKVDAVSKVATAPSGADEKSSSIAGSAVEPAAAPKAFELVSDAEEAAAPGRRDFLKLLDLLDEKKPPAVVESESKQAAEPKVELPVPSTAPGRRPTMTFAQLQQAEYDKLYDAWLEDPVERPFVALENWEKARTLALIAENGGSFDPSVMYTMYRQQNDLLQQLQSVNQRFDSSSAVLEALVMDRGFVRRVNAFLHKHHKVFLNSKPARERGEFSHQEFAVFRQYSEIVQQLVLGELQSKVEGFDADEFFDALFDTPASSITPADEEDDDDIATSLSGGQQQALSFEVWEVLLSFLKFENFCDVMDDYIATHYNTNTYENAIGASKVGGLRGVKRRSPPPPVMQGAKTPPTAASQAAASGPSTTGRASSTASLSSSAAGKPTAPLQGRQLPAKAPLSK